MLGRRLTFNQPVSFFDPCAYERIYALPPDLILKPQTEYRISGWIRGRNKSVSLFEFNFHTDARAGRRRTERFNLTPRFRILTCDSYDRFLVALRFIQVLTPAVHNVANEVPEIVGANPFTIRLMNMPWNFESKLSLP